MMESKKIYALQTARAGSKSIKNKNTLDVNGIPLYLYNIFNAMKSKYIEDIYISTDDLLIKENSEKYNYKVINRPSSLCQDNSSHRDTIIHAVEDIERNIQDKIDVLVILLGNSLGAKKEDIDKSIEILLSNEELDSVTSVSKFNMFNPFRAHQVSQEGVLETYLPQEMIIESSKKMNINDRGSAGDIYFFNGSFWICKRHAIFDKNGKMPFPWAGKKSHGFVQDVTMELDDIWQLKFIRGN